MRDTAAARKRDEGRMFAGPGTMAQWPQWMPPQQQLQLQQQQQAFVAPTMMSVATTAMTTPATKGGKLTVAAVAPPTATTTTTTTTRPRGGSVEGPANPNPATNPALHPGPLTNPLFKTRMCKNFEADGTCRYHLKCQFAHGAEELAYWQKWHAEKERARRAGRAAQRRRNLSAAAAAAQAAAVHLVSSVVGDDDDNDEHEREHCEAGAEDGGSEGEFENHSETGTLTEDEANPAGAYNGYRINVEPLLLAAAATATATPTPSTDAAALAAMGYGPRTPQRTRRASVPFNFGSASFGAGEWSFRGTTTTTAPAPAEEPVTRERANTFPSEEPTGDATGAVRTFDVMGWLHESPVLVQLPRSHPHSPASVSATSTSSSLAGGRAPLVWGY